MVELGFVHGRFQLFHNDHLAYVIEAKKQCKKIIVGVTSPENSHLIREEIDPHRCDPTDNPFTFYERFCMIKVALLEAGLKREDFEIVPYPIEQPDILYNYIPLNATSFFTIYDKWGYEKLHRLRELGYNTVVLFDDHEKKMCSTDLRKAIVDNTDEWKKFVPNAVCKYLAENNLLDKIKKCCKAK